MIADILAQRLAFKPEFSTIILVFFAYSLLGYYLECLVLSIDKRRLVIDRGFASHMPFCIIYGFGALAGYALLSPFHDNLLLLFIAGAFTATFFEYVTARLQIRLFGDFWWDYTEKPFNYQGILCLESTVGWGLAAILIICFVHRPLVGLIARIPETVAVPLAVLLVVAYVGDFLLSARAANREKDRAAREAEPERLYFDN